MNIQNFSILASIIISLNSLFIVIYKEFLQGFKLYSEINDVVLIHTPENNKEQIISEIILDDFMADDPSQQASKFLEQQPTLAHIAQTRNREKLMVELSNYTNQHPLTYDPPVHFIESYLKDLRLGVSFYIPLVIYNSGKKFAYLSSMVLIAKLNNTSKKWAFAPILEIDPIKLIHRNQDNRFIDLVSNTSSSYAIGPQESIRINPLFSLRPDANNQIISSDNIAPGNYDFVVYGYGPKGKKILETRPINYNLTVQNLVKTFLGTDISVNISVEKNLVLGFSVVGLQSSA